jgi:hypothetical protein
MVREGTTRLSLSQLKDKGNAFFKKKVRKLSGIYRASTNIAMP